MYAYARLFADGEIGENEPVNVVVPTGNFGNILAAYYAKQMGLPIGKLICASNDNKVLYDFFRTGSYDRNREFLLTSSPSMDILISSNLERLIYQIADQSDETDRRLMKELAENGRYEITSVMGEKLGDFYGGYASEKEAAAVIRSVYEAVGYVMDTHTAVASCVYEKYRKDTGDSTKTIIASTASPYKFTGSVMEALGETAEGMDDFELADRLAVLSGVPVPGAVEEIRRAEVLHSTVVNVNEMKQAVRGFLG